MESQIFRDPTRFSPIPTPPDLIVAAARRSLGVPFKHLGRDERGLDCVGLIVTVGRELGMMNYDLRAYPRHPDGSSFMRYFREAGLKDVAWRDRQAGDIILMHDGRYPCHTGILSSRDPDLVVHAYALRRRVIEEPMGGFLRSRLIGAYRFPGVEKSP